MMARLTDLELLVLEEAETGHESHVHNRTVSGKVVLHVLSSSVRVQSTNVQSSTAHPFKFRVEVRRERAKVEIQHLSPSTRSSERLVISTRFESQVASFLSRFASIRRHDVSHQGQARNRTRCDGRLLPHRVQKTHSRESLLLCLPCAFRLTLRLSQTPKGTIRLFDRTVSSICALHEESRLIPRIKCTSGLLHCTRPGRLLRR